MNKVENFYDKSPDFTDEELGQLAGLFFNESTGSKEAFDSFWNELDPSCKKELNTRVRDAHDKNEISYQSS